MSLYTDLVQVGVAMLIMIAIGWTLQRLHVFKAQDFKSANKLCSKVGLPFLMFGTFIKQTIKNISWWPLLVTALVNCSLHIILLLSILVWRKKGLEKYVTLQISTCYVNFIVIGLPIFTSIWGENSAHIAIICPFFHYFFVVPLYMLLSNIVRIKKENEQKGAEDFVYHLTFHDIGVAIWKSCKTPLLVGAFLGLIWSCTTLKTPIFLLRLSKYVGDFVIVFSLLGIGSFLESNSIVACEISTLLICVVMRFIISPILGISFCLAFKIKGELGRQISILTTMPLSTIAFILSSATGIGMDSTSSVVFWTVIFVIPAIIFWFWILNTFKLFQTSA